MRSGCDTTTPCAHGLTAREIGQTKMATQSLKEALSQALACRLWPVYGLPMGMHGVSLGCKLIYIYILDTLGFEPRAFRMQSGCDTTTPCAR